MLPVSLTFAGALALINLFLAYRVARVRIASKVLVGDGDHPLLRARMRAQANFVEYTPFVLILMALLEYAGAPTAWLWGIGIVYAVARILHAFGMDRTQSSPLRATGAMVTWGILLILAIWAIWMASHAPVPMGHVRPL